MKRLIGLILAVCAAAGLAVGDTYTWTGDAVANGATLTNQVVASGWLDKIEISQEAAATCTVVVATYSDLGAAVDTYASVSATTADNTVIRPGAVRTSTAGVAITASTSDTTNTTTMLTANYDRIMIGGNVRILASAGDTVGNTNSIKVVIYYEPTKR